MSEEDWLVDEKSGIRYKLPEDKEQSIWYVNYVKDSTYTYGTYTAQYGSIGPMTYSKASALFDRMDKGSTTMHSISKIPKFHHESK